MTRYAFLLFPLTAFGQLHLDSEKIPTPNIVGAGMNFQHAAKTKEAALWTFLGGGVATAILATSKDTKNGAAPWVVGGLTLGVSVGLTFHGLKWDRMAGGLLQSGYSPNYFYESIPDSIGDDPPRRYKLRDIIDGYRIHIPVRFR